MYIFDQKDWKRYFGITLGSKTLKTAGKFPWKTRYLKKQNEIFNYREEEAKFFFLALENFGDDRLTILQWHKMLPPTEHPRFNCENENPWFASEDFATKRTCQTGWREAYLYPLPNSENMTEEEVTLKYPQCELMPAIEKIALEILFRAKYGRYCDTEFSICTSDKTRNGHSVGVECDEKTGIYIFPVVEPVAAAATDGLIWH